jgi:hypothetical protein
VNKRIQELGDRAYKMTQEEFGQDWNETPPENWNRRFRENFAYLIILECCEVAHCNAHVSGWSLSYVFKEYFGVEE